MNDITVFEHSKSGRVWTVQIDGEPWLVGKDATDILGYQNGSRDINRLKRKNMEEIMISQEIEQMISDNEKLVFFVVNTYFPNLRGDEDIIQCGRIGLWKASRSFDDTKGTFSTLAARCIKNEILRELRSRKKEQKKGDILSLDTTFISNNDGDETAMINMLPYIENRYDMADYDLSAVEKRLSARDFRIFKLYIHGFTENEIGKEYGLAQAWISRIIKRAKAVARKELLPDRLS